MLVRRVVRFVPIILLATGACSEVEKPGDAPAPAAVMNAPSTPTGHYDVARDPAVDVAAAVKVASAENKRILLVVGGEWCSWCHILDSYLKANADVRKAWDDRYVTVFVNWSEENKNEAFLSKFPKISGYPHIFVLDQSGQLLHSQDTALLEEGRSYSKTKMQEFLDRWRAPASV